MTEHTNPAMRVRHGWRLGVAILVWYAQCIGYWVRPYDMLADRRRWFWQKRTRCGLPVRCDLCTLRRRAHRWLVATIALFVAGVIADVYGPHWVTVWVVNSRSWVWVGFLYAYTRGRVYQLSHHLPEGAHA